MNDSESRIRLILLTFLLFTFYTSNSQTVNKQFYLSDPSQGINLIDPVTEADATTS